MIIDYRLQDMTGDDFAQCLAEDVKTILVTGELDLKPKQQFDLVVPKPYKLKDLKALIEKMTQ